MLLLFIIYIAFIGLGLPDSLFGTAWPAIYADFELPFSYGSFVTSLVYFGTMISSIASAKMIHRFGTGSVTALSTLLTAFAMIGYASSQSYIYILLCALPLGLGAGAIDTALNNYVAIHYSASHMNFLHCFYGIGITVSPFILAQTISGHLGWRGGYTIAFAIQLSIAILLFLTLSLWKKERIQKQAVTEEPVDILTFREILHTPNVKTMWILFFFSCAIECTCGAWGSTYLVETQHILPEVAASRILFYFAGVAIGRFLSGVFSKRVTVYKIINLSMWGLLFGVICLFLPGSDILMIIGFTLIGMGNGPMFPNLNYLTPIIYGEAKSPSIIGSQMTVASLSFMIMPIVFGQLATILGIRIFPLLLALFLIVLNITYIKMQKNLKTASKSLE